MAQSMAGGDPNLRLLKKRLQAKKELLKQLKVMYTSFMGGSGARELPCACVCVH